MAVKIDLDLPISEFVNEIVTAEEDETVSAVAKKMVRKGVGALIVTSEDKPVGIITEMDMLNKVVAADKNPGTTKVSAVMSSPIRKIDYSATVGDAINEMVKNGIRRLAVTKNGKIIGLVTQRSIIAGSRFQVVLPELESTKILRCPYCSEGLKDQKELSRHIDLMHIGKGLLQGDLRKW